MNNATSTEGSLSANTTEARIWDGFFLRARTAGRRVGTATQGRGCTSTMEKIAQRHNKTSIRGSAAVWDELFLRARTAGRRVGTATRGRGCTSTMEKITQRHNAGAMFGLDARVAIAIFAAVTVSVAAISAGNISYIYAQALSDELKQFAEAVEGFHTDVRKDIFRTLTEANNTDAFRALYDPSVMKSSRDRGLWLGPYLKIDSNKHNRYGEMTLAKKGYNITDKCKPGKCFLWISFDTMPEAVRDHTNSIFDPEDEDLKAQYNGRVQWEPYSDETGTMWFRLSQAIR